MDNISIMCQGTTSDGRLYVDELEIQARCSADATCAGDGQLGGYYRPIDNTSFG